MLSRRKTLNMIYKLQIQTSNLSQTPSVLNLTGYFKCQEGILAKIRNPIFDIYDKNLPSAKIFHSRLECMVLNNWMSKVEVNLTHVSKTINMILD